LIPKIIWQTHEYEYKDLPVNYKKSADTWKNVNQGWDYRYISAKERSKIVAELDPYLHELFFSEERVGTFYGKVHQADIFRYLVTYEFGGVYADMDSVCKKPLDYMIGSIHEDYEVLYATEKSSQYNNAMFAATPKSSVLENIIKNIKSSNISQAKVPEKELPDPVTGTHYSSHYFPKGSLHEIWSNEVKFNTQAKPLFSAGSHSKDYLEYPSTISIHDWCGLALRIDYYGEIILYPNLIERLGISI